jgi:hypothetical protein
MDTDDEDTILSILTMEELGFNRYERDIVDLLLVDMICGPDADVERMLLLEEEKAEQRRRRKSPEFRCRMPIMILDDGSRVGRPPTKSVWYENFIATTPTHPSVLKEFRKAFRLPLDQRWQQGVASEYECDYGRLTSADFPHSFGLPQNRNHEIDTSGMGHGRDVDNSLPIPHDATISQIPSGNATRIVRNLNRDFFRDKLIEHFSILLRQKKIRWPSRIGLKLSANVSRVLSHLPEIDVGIGEQQELE